jgi:hypothetical protein
VNQPHANVDRSKGPFDVSQTRLQLFLSILELVSRLVWSLCVSCGDCTMSRVTCNPLRSSSIAALKRASSATRVSSVPSRGLTFSREL